MVTSGIVPRMLSPGWYMGNSGKVKENSEAHVSELYIQMRSVSVTGGAGLGPAGNKT